MSTVTTRLGLTKPIDVEQFSLATYNNNLNLIDAGVLAEETERKKIRHAELTVIATPYPNSSEVWGPGTFTLDSAIQYNNDFVIADAGDRIKLLKVGIYHTQWLMSGAGIPPGGEVVIKNETTNTALFTDDLHRDVSWGPCFAATFYAAANDIIRFYTVNRLGGFTNSSRIKVTKIQ